MASAWAFAWAREIGATCLPGKDIAIRRSRVPDRETLGAIL
jgi:hypothetical protein